MARPPQCGAMRMNACCCLLGNSAMSLVGFECGMQQVALCCERKGSKSHFAVGFKQRQYLVSATTTQLSLRRNRMG
jgi:hypothetical protein